jgi:hypothetical protein
MLRMDRGSPLVPVAGMGVAFVALLLWVSSVAWQRLDAVVLVLFLLGVALSLSGYLFGRDAAVKRLGVIALGANAFGAILLALVYAAG